MVQTGKELEADVYIDRQARKTQIIQSEIQEKEVGERERVR